MSEKNKHSGTKDQMDKHAHDIMRVLKSIDSHLASMVYETTPSRGFAANIERAIAQPFTGDMNENKDNVLESMIRKEIKKSLGDK
jgi:hypothetical protein|tara:strand:- start:462 stop:716 length:255 start_codon:yes stop_codon:yes gene_type:complete